MTTATAADLAALRARAGAALGRRLTPMPGDRAAIEAAFGVPVSDLFGATEGLVGHSDPGGLVLTFATDMRLVEAVDDDNQPVDDRLFRRGVDIFRELGLPFYLAVTLLELGEWLVAQGRGEEAEPTLAEAREIFERLEAKPWLERLDSVPARTPAEISA